MKMSDEYYYDEYFSGLHGVLQTLTRAVRLDKKMMRTDFSKVFGDQIGRWMIHVNVQGDEPRLYIISRWIAGESVKAFLRGRYSGNLVVPVEAKVLMMELGVKRRFDWMNLPQSISLQERIIRDLLKGVERGR